MLFDCTVVGLLSMFVGGRSAVLIPRSSRTYTSVPGFIFAGQAKTSHSIGVSGEAGEVVCANLCKVDRDCGGFYLDRSTCRLADRASANILAEDTEKLGITYYRFEREEEVPLRSNSESSTITTSKISTGKVSQGDASTGTIDRKEEANKDTTDATVGEHGIDKTTDDPAESNNVFHTEAKGNTTENSIITNSHDGATQDSHEMNHDGATHDNHEMNHDGATHDNNEMNHDGATHNNNETNYDGATHDNNEMNHDGATHNNNEMNHAGLTNNSNETNHDGATHDNNEMNHDGATHNNNETNHNGATNDNNEMNHDGATHNNHETNHDGATHDNNEMNHDGKTM